MAKQPELRKKVPKALTYVAGSTAASISMETEGPSKLLSDYLDLGHLAASFKQVVVRGTTQHQTEARIRPEGLGDDIHLVLC